MDIPKTEQEIYKFVDDEYNEVVDLHSDLNKNYIDYIRENISQRREWLKYLATIAAGVVGLAPTVFDKVKHQNLFYAAILLLILVVILVTSYLRSTLDGEGNELIKQLKNYNSLLSSQIERTRKFLLSAQFTPEAFRAYLQEGKDIQKGVDNLWGNQKKELAKDGGVEHRDYVGEFSVYFFIFGTILLLASVSSINFRIWWFALFGVILFGITFFFPQQIFIWAGYPIDLARHKIKRFL